MTQSPKLEDMDSVYLGEELSEKEGFDKSNDSYVVDMDRFSHFIHDKDMISANSRITRNLSRKLGGGEKKFNNDRNAHMLTTSPKECTPEKPKVVGLGSTDNSVVNHHHQITITNGSISTTNINTNTDTENTFGRKRLLSFRRSHATTFIDPRKILFFFATLSSMGTIILIYFTLSISKLNSDDGSAALMN